MDEITAQTEAATKEASNAVAVANEAKAKAQEALLAAAIEKGTKEVKDSFISELHKIFAVDSGDSQVLVKRIPLICQDITGMKHSIEKIEGNISKVVWIVLSAVIGAVLMTVLK